MDSLCIKCSNYFEAEYTKEGGLFSSEFCIIIDKYVGDINVFKCNQYQEKPECQTQKTES